MACSCFECSSAPKQLSNELNMQSVEIMFKKQEEDLFNRENGNKSGFRIGISHIRNLTCLGTRNISSSSDSEISSW